MNTEKENAKEKVINADTVYKVFFYGFAVIIAGYIVGRWAAGNPVSLMQLLLKNSFLQF